ncbi:MAG TPA: ATP-binding protein [Tepidisphaeraceae bacterium]
MEWNVVFYSGALILQLAATLYAVRMLTFTRSRWPWAILLLALALMTAYRAIAVLHSLPNPPLKFIASNYDRLGAISTFAVSALLLTALLPLRRLTQRDQESTRIRQEVEQQLASLINHMPAHVYIKDLRGRYIMANQRFTAATGFPLEKILRRTDAELFPDAAAESEQREAEIAATRRSQTDERLTQTAAGARHLLTTKFPLFDRASAVQAICGVATDITAIKQTEAERDRLLASEKLARAQAEAANTAKDRFLAVLSHELRTPLSPVLMSVAALESDATLPAEVRAELAMIRRNIELEVRLIDDLLDLSRVRSGKLRIEPRPTNAHDLLRHVVTICADDFRARSLQISLDLSADRDVVTGDPARLQQVFWNLLKNAVKFTPSGKAIRISTSNPVYDTLEVVVADEGVGFSKESGQRLFMAFEQGRLNDSMQFGGLGLGLAICQAIVDAHGGTISGQSDGENKGASFTVKLPVTQDTPAAAPARASAAITSDNKLRVLLVEDHIDTARVLQRLLKSVGYDVTAKHNVTDALEELKANRFDVLLSDIGLPDGDGYELMSEARRLYQIKGICMTGYGMDEDIRRGREAGFIEHVVKPVELAQLQAALNRVIG